MSVGKHWQIKTTADQHLTLVDTDMSELQPTNT